MDSSVSGRPPVLHTLTTTVEHDGRKLLEELTHCRNRLKAKHVHALRTCIRRLLAALELAATLGAHCKPGVARSLGKLLAALSPLRDRQVQLRALETMAGDRHDVSALSARLHKQKRELAHEAGRRLARFDADRFQDDMAKVAQKLAPDATASGDEDAAHTAIRGDLARRHLQVSRQRAQVTAEDPGSLHELRLALKSYRYGLAAVAPALPEAGRAVSAAVTRLQDQLGTAHDAHVLARTAVSARSSHAGSATKRLSRALEHASRDAQRDAAAAVKSAELDWLL